MIIQCINCNKRFEVNSDLIPSEGRSIQCGSCNHMWFFNKNDQVQKDILKPLNQNQSKTSKQDKNNELTENKSIDTNNNLNDQDNGEINKKTFVKKKTDKKHKFSFDKFLAYLVIFIISFVALIIILNTFKSFFYKIFPNLEFILFNFFETLKDIILFIKDLI